MRHWDWCFLTIKPAKRVKATHWRLDAGGPPIRRGGGGAVQHRVSPARGEGHPSWAGRVGEKGTRRISQPLNQRRHRSAELLFRFSRAESKRAVSFGQAILARAPFRITATTTSPMGDDGIIRRTWSLTPCRGLVDKQIPGAVGDRFWQRLVLPHGQAVSQIVRLDRGPVTELLARVLKCRLICSSKSQPIRSPAKTALLSAAPASRNRSA